MNDATASMQDSTTDTSQDDRNEMSHHAHAQVLCAGNVDWESDGGLCTAIDVFLDSDHDFHKHNLHYTYTITRTRRGYRRGVTVVEVEVCGFDDDGESAFEEVTANNVAQVIFGDNARAIDVSLPRMDVLYDCSDALEVLRVVGQGLESATVLSSASLEQTSL